MMKTNLFVAAAIGCIVVGGCARGGNNVQAAANGASVAAPSANAVAAPAPAANTEAAVTVDANREMDLTGEGFTAGQRGLHHNDQIAFGQPQAEVVRQVSAILGAPSATGRNAECPNGAVDYVSFGGLDLHFQDGRFAGWLLDGDQPALDTYQGLAVGARRADLTDELEAEPVEGSTIGDEVMVNGVGAMLNGPGADARVTSLFAGVTCFAR